MKLVDNFYSHLVGPYLYYVDRWCSLEGWISCSCRVDDRVVRVISWYRLAELHCYLCYLWSAAPDLNCARHGAICSSLHCSTRSYLFSETRVGIAIRLLVQELLTTPNTTPFETAIEPWTHSSRFLAIRFSCLPTLQRDAQRWLRWCCGSF